MRPIVASSVSWGRGRSALNAMIQGHTKVEYVKENRRKTKEDTNMIPKKKRKMPNEEREIELEQIGAVALISA